MDLNELSFFTWSGGRLFVIAGDQLFLVPPFGMRKKLVPLLNTPKNSGPPPKQTAPLPVNNDSSLIRICHYTT